MMHGTVWGKLPMLSKAFSLALWVAVVIGLATSLALGQQTTGAAAPAAPAKAAAAADAKAAARPEAVKDEEADVEADEEAAADAAATNPEPPEYRVERYRYDLVRTPAGNQAPMSYRRYSAGMAASGYVPKVSDGFDPLVMPTGAGIQIDTLKAILFPTLILEETYNTNVFLDRGNQQDDWQTHARANLDIVRPLNKNRTMNLLIGLFGDQTWSRFIEELGVASAGASATLQMTLPATNTEVRLGTLFDYFETPAENQNTRKQPATHTLNKAELRQKLGRRYTTDVRVAYETQHFNRRDDRLDDFDRSSLVWNGFMYYSPKTALQLQAEGARINHVAENRDNWYSQASAGVVMDPTSKLSGSILVGWEFRYFDTNFGTGVNSVMLNNKARTNTNAFRIASDLSYAVTPKLGASLRVFRGTQETSDYYENLKDGRYYTTTGATSSLTYRPARDVILSGRASVVHDRFGEAGTLELGEVHREPFWVDNKIEVREDTLYGLGGSITKNFKNGLSLGADYDWSQKDSNVNGEDYTDDGQFVLRASWDKQWTRGNRVKPYLRVGMQRRAYSTSSYHGQPVQEYENYFATLGVQATF